MASQKGLGKGLGALLGDFTEEPLEKAHTSCCRSTR